MRWEAGRRSSNFEDRRGSRVGRGAMVGGGGLLVALVLTLLGAPQSLVQEVLTGAPGSTGTEPGAPAQPRDPAEERLADFSRVVLADTEDTWGALFAHQGQRYAPPNLVVFSGGVESACGDATSAVGPFYCPGDKKIYLDLSFLETLDQRFGAPGDFAQAYVVAHEVGHHIQTLLGTSERVHAERRGLPEAAANALSVRMELQADCFAGVWGHHAQRSKNVQLDPGDLDEALRAASAIGDDTLQKRGRGRVAPDSFTHGTSEQRARWFRAGFSSGRAEDCDTFNARAI